MTRTADPMTSASELTARLRAGLKSVTPGPWLHSREREDAPVTGRCFDVGSPTRLICGKSFALDANHIANCSPDNIALLLDAFEEAENRVEELESAGEAVSVEFEKDCWVAMRSLLNECNFDWSWVDGDGVTADTAREHISETISELGKDRQSAIARAEKAEAAFEEKCREVERLAERISSISAERDDWKSYYEAGLNEWLRAEKAEMQLAAISVCTTEFMDPPDGGEPTLAEQVTRMHGALNQARGWLQTAIEHGAINSRTYNAMEALDLEAVARAIPRSSLLAKDQPK
jgi:hypothetical protein